MLLNLDKILYEVKKKICKEIKMLTSHDTCCNKKEGKKNNHNKNKVDDFNHIFQPLHV
jgi:hypothetical protein